jgi:hypothetical protein
MVLAKAALGADAAEPATPSASSRADGLVMLDYPSIPIRGCPSIDLLGAHVFTQFNDWLHLGIGAHASLVKGGYGAFIGTCAGVGVRFAGFCAGLNVSLGASSSR